MHRCLSRGYPGIDTLVLTDSVLGARPLATSLLQSRLGGYMLSTRGRQRGYGSLLARPRLTERSESRCPLGPGFLHVVSGDELLRQQWLQSLQMIVGMLELRLQPGNLGVGDNRIHLPARDIRGGGGELGFGLGHASDGSSSAVLQAVDFSTGQGQRGSCAL